MLRAILLILFGASKALAVMSIPRCVKAVAARLRSIKVAFDYFHLRQESFWELPGRGQVYPKGGNSCVMLVPNSSDKTLR